MEIDENQGQEPVASAPSPQESEPAPQQPPQPQPQQPPQIPPAYQSYYGYQPPYVYPNQPYRYVRPVPPPVRPKPQEPQKQQGTPFWKKFVAGVLVLALVACGCGITASVVESRIEKKNESLNLYYQNKISVLQQQLQENTDRTNQKLDQIQSQIQGESPVAGPMTPAQVYAQNVSSVVAINNTTSGVFGTTAVSSGSGFVLTEDGYIVSNYHVVDGASKLTVTFSDGKEHSATYIGGDEANDIALLKISATGLRPVTVGRSDDLIVGAQVAAIGNPLGELASTLTVGFLSAKDRVIVSEGSQINMMQTDAAINPGNSGGPLFNMEGQVVGITTAKYSGTTSSGASIEGIGFAIPMDDVIDMLMDLKEHGYITGAYLGVTVTNVSLDDVKQYGLPMGVLVNDVVSGSCAQLGGIRSQDIIVDLGGYEIENVNDLTRALRKYEAGDTISVVVYRHSAGGEVVLSLTLDEKPRSPQKTVTPTGLPSGGSADEWFGYFFGS
ncbi:MAG: trypsin-like peptidase domain-containing protein [Oscillospiraceae bacterium]|nr:trypsin-like peptidase domain-containing protein [Oscillospiraceae bacterium]